jgi:hypothetical protein
MTRTCRIHADLIFVLDYTGLPYKQGQRADFEMPEGFTCHTYKESDGTEAQRGLPRPIAFFKWEESHPKIKYTWSAYDEAQAKYYAEKVPEDGKAGSNVKDDCATEQVGALMPLAIRVGQKDTSRIYTPADGAKHGCMQSHDWLFAKLCVQIADHNCHEMQVRAGPKQIAVSLLVVNRHSILLTT